MKWIMTINNTVFVTVDENLEKYYVIDIEAASKFSSEEIIDPNAELFNLTKIDSTNKLLCYLAEKFRNKEARILVFPAFKYKNDGELNWFIRGVIQEFSESGFKDGAFFVELIRALLEVRKDIRPDDTLILVDRQRIVDFIYSAYSTAEYDYCNCLCGDLKKKICEPGRTCCNDCKYYGGDENKERSIKEIIRWLERGENDEKN